MVVTFTHDKSTKNTERFTAEYGSDVIFGSLFMLRSTWDQIGKPNTIKVDCEVNCDEK